MGVCIAGMDTTSTIQEIIFRVQFIRIEALVLFGIAALFLLLVLGSYRRRSSHKAVKFIVWGAYAMSYFLVGYTIGLMQSFPLGNSLFTVWAICLTLILGSVDSLSAYSLDDNDNWKRIYTKYLGTSLVTMIVACSMTMTPMIIGRGSTPSTRPPSV